MAAITPLIHPTCLSFARVLARNARPIDRVPLAWLWPTPPTTLPVIHHTLPLIPAAAFAHALPHHVSTHANKYATNVSPAAATWDAWLE